MSEGSSAVRQRLFDLYSRHARLYWPEMRDRFICPLCLREFSREALAGTVPSLTLAHIIPDCLGGKVCTRACASCNNSVGHRLEAFWAERLRLEDWLKGVGRTKARLSGSFGSVPIEVGMSLEGTPSALYIKRSPDFPAKKALRAELRHILNGRKQALELSINWMHRDVPWHSQVAVYQSAYLLMFHYFGYEFVYHPHSAKLREQFEKPEEAICDLRVAMVEPASTIEFDRNCAIMIPRAIPVFLAGLRLRPKQGSPQVVVVALPGPDNTELSEVREGDFTGPTISYKRERLLDTPHYMHKLWIYVRQGGRAR